jgi:Protein of unknown function (DUF1439)
MQHASSCRLLAKCSASPNEAGRSEESCMPTHICATLPIPALFRHCPMWKRRILIGLATLLTIGGVAWLLVDRYAPGLAIELTEEELQARLAARFPIQNCALSLICLDIPTPRLKLLEGSDRIALDGVIDAVLGPRRYPGTLSFSGKLRYVEAEGSFYLDDITIEQFDIVGVPTHYTEILRLRGPNLLRSVLAARPIYTLRNDNTKERLARFAIGDVRVVNGKLRISLLSPTRQ